MAGKTDAKRLVDLAAALKKAKPKDVVTLETLSAIWGVAKPRFVTVARNFIDFPEPVGKEGNAYLLPAQKCFRSMIDYLKRHQEASKSRATRLGALIGSDQMAEHMAGGFSIAELARANQLAAELEQRQRDQGLFIPAADVQRTIGLVFSEISEFMSNLSNLIDPHGNRFSPALRSAVDTAAHEQLLRVHGQLKGMLSPDVKPNPTRKPARKPRKAPARRKSKRSGSRKT
jgi:hypothetical protein